MTAAKLKEILKDEYGINDEMEFELAVKGVKGVNLGIFTMPLNERSIKNEQKTKTTACA